jgi:hypothetical protein
MQLPHATNVIDVSVISRKRLDKSHREMFPTAGVDCGQVAEVDLVADHQHEKYLIFY